MNRVEVYQKNDGGKVYLVYCPGCNGHHALDVGTPNEGGAQWQFNGDFEKPTFSPSLLVFPNDPSLRCHSFIRDGKIEFLTDSYHRYAGKTVELAPAD